MLRFARVLPTRAAPLHEKPGSCSKCMPRSAAPTGRPPRALFHHALRVPCKLQPSPMPTFAAVDIGSNSVRLKIASTSGNRLHTLHEDREVTRLGESVFRG